MSAEDFHAFAYPYHQSSVRAVGLGKKLKQWDAGIDAEREIRRMSPPQHTTGPTMIFLGIPVVLNTKMPRDRVVLRDMNDKVVDVLYLEE